MADSGKEQWLDFQGITELRHHRGISKNKYSFYYKIGNLIKTQNESIKKQQ